MHHAEEIAPEARAHESEHHGGLALWSCKHYKTQMYMVTYT